MLGGEQCLADVRRGRGGGVGRKRGRASEGGWAQ